MLNADFSIIPILSMASDLEDTADFPAPVMDMSATAQVIVHEMQKRTGNEGRHQEIIARSLDGAERRVQERILIRLARALNVRPVYRNGE